VRPPSRSLHDLARSASAEAERLADDVAILEAHLTQALQEAELVAGWDGERVELLRSALREPRFADVTTVQEGLRLARAELESVQDLRAGLAGRLRDLG
jgi:hypothetical protein